MKTMKRFSLVVLLVLCSLGAFAQKEKTIDFNLTEIPSTSIPSVGIPQIQASQFKVYSINTQQVMNQLVGIANRAATQTGFVGLINLPHPDGSFHSYRATANNTMSPALAEQFPEIKSFDAVGEDGSFVKWDITPKGFHAMIMRPGKSTVFIDPLFDGNSSYCIVYEKDDFISNKQFECAFDSDLSDLINKKIATSGEMKVFGTCQLRTYRLALSATGEYTTFHGGTVALALAAQVTTMNRVNGVFERDIAITMEIIANNNLIVYTNAASDPFANGTPGTMINQNQTNTDAVIGSANYDIGHVFGTNSGGLAGLGVVCASSQKARGVTGSAAPVGDPFDIDYVAHEMGHQFGANHTQNNNCNRNNATAMEPGSASSIMGYAGICAPDVQSNSDDHFHGVSLGEIHTEIMSSGHTCEVITGLANNPPVILSTNANVSIPAGTPFALTAVANDPDGDPLSYCWEQMNNQVTTQPPVSTATGGPNFRSLSPDPNPTRYFPNLTALANNGPFTWEVVPTVSRTMNFRLTVRDQGLNVPGCNDHSDVTLTFTASAGPFVVNYPSATGITWTGATNETVTWSVANTDVSPVNCTSVNILLSTDGGLTYPITLASGVANDGSEVIAVPNIATTTARVMVISSAGTFFDISNNNFTIVLATLDFTQTVTPATQSICQPDNATYTVDINEIGGYSDPVTLSVSGVPVGASSSFSMNPVTPVGSSVLTISNTAAVTPGSYNLVVSGTSTTGTKTSNITLIVSASAPGAVTQLTPTNLATAVNVPTDFTWTTTPEPGVSYEIEIATDPGFSTIVDAASGLATASYTSSVLLSSTTYYWRVRSMTGCGQSAWSAAFSFTTNSCTQYSSVDVGQTTDVASFTSEIVVTTTGSISGIQLNDLDISHPWVGDLAATLTSPSGTVISLFDGPGIPASTWGCDGDDILASFDDAASLTAANLESMCGAMAPSITGTFQPLSSLNTLIGEPMNGTWLLTVYDSYITGDHGTLNGWSLTICSPPVSCLDPDLATLAAVSAICEGTSVNLNITSGNLNDASDWQWYEGSCGGTAIGTGTSITITPIASTSYFVRGEGGCVIPGVCEQIDVVVNPNYSASVNETICIGTTYTYPDGMSELISANTTHTSSLLSMEGCDSIIVSNITAVSGFTSNENISVCAGADFTYPDGTLAQNLSADESHVSSLLSSGGCDSLVTTNLSVIHVDVAVNSSGLTLTANAGGASYQWIDCTNGNLPLPGETNASYTATAISGSYAVIVSDNGCSDTSSCYVIDQSDLSEMNENDLKIYPNPGSGDLQIEWSGRMEKISIHDAQGRLVYEVEVTEVNQLTIPLEISAGVYYLMLQNQQTRLVKELLRD